MSFGINNLFIITCFVINVGFSIGIPLNNDDDNKQLNNVKLPPLYFPNDTNLYQILPSDNKTALNILSHLTTNDDKADVKLTNVTSKKDDDLDEVDYSDVVETKSSATTITACTTSTETIKQTTSTINSINNILKQNDTDEKRQQDNDDDTVFYDDANDVASDSPKLEVEGIQSDNKERNSDELEENFHRMESKEIKLPIDDTLTVDLTTLHGGHIAGIFATVFVVLSIIAYITLIIWRARLEKKYGNRERLVTEDDYYNNNDMRHFEL